MNHFEKLDERQRRLIANCRDYALNDPAGVPGHNLMLIIAQMAEMLDGVMSKGDALALFHDVENGTHEIRSEYLEKFGAGSVAIPLWNDPTFTYGIEYGIKMAIARLFNLDPENHG